MHGIDQYDKHDDISVISRNRGAHYANNIDHFDFFINSSYVYAAEEF